MTEVIKTHIIPILAQFAQNDQPHELDKEAICTFTAIGFFLDSDSWWKNKKILQPASTHRIDSNGKIMSSVPWFRWYYAPRDISFDDALDEFISLFETIIKEQTFSKKVILPLSGGLDSRTQAAALKYLGSDVYSYSYKFKNGYNETKIARAIARACDFDFKGYSIPVGYLWQKLDALVELNQCYADFTAPRQMALYDEFATMGDVFSLGHWGDVLFDNMGLTEIAESEQVDILLKKLLKRGGMQLASDLWIAWGLNGNFKDHLKERILSLLRKIDIQNTNARLRAFKSLYWAPRWTSVNLNIFSSKKPITLPYYDDRMCEFICSIPESFLENRQLQIAYIKARNPELAKITWQDHRPFNLNNYKLNRTPYNIPYKITNKLKRSFKTLLGRPYVQRNWELQFKGKENSTHLEYFLLMNQLKDLVPADLIQKYYYNFLNRDPLNNAHAINMLLVLSKFNQNLRHA